MFNPVKKDFKAMYSTRMERNMFMLVKKDFIVSYSFLLFAIVTWVMYAMMAFLYDMMVPLAMLFAIGLPFTFVLVDTIFKADVHYASLPLKRSGIVYARYFSSLIMVIIALVLTVITGIVLQNVFSKADKGFEIMLNFWGIVGFLSFVFISLSYLLPFIFRFGFARGVGIASSTVIVAALLVTGFKLLIPVIQGDTVFITSFFKNILNELLGLIELLGNRGIQTGLIVP